MLTQDQIAFFHKEGYLFLPETFRARRWRPCATQQRTSTASSVRKSGVRRPARRATPSPRIPTTKVSPPAGARTRGMVEPLAAVSSARSVYVHQFKLNAKAAFDG